MGRHIKFRDARDDGFVRNATIQIEALNHALAEGARLATMKLWERAVAV